MEPRCWSSSGISVKVQRPPLTPVSSPPLCLKQSPVEERRRRRRKRMPVKRRATATSMSLLDAFVDSTFRFVEQPILNKGNFAPVDETNGVVALLDVEGRIPDEFPTGVYIRTGVNHLYPNQTATESIFGKTKYHWVEGDGMLHAVYFDKDDDGTGRWCLSYRNRYVEAETFLLEKERKRASFIPAASGSTNAVFAAAVLNMMRYGKAYKDYNNTNVVDHGGRVFSLMEGSLPYEIDPSSLETLGAWDVGGAWAGPFSAHPKKAPGTGEMITIGTSSVQPYCVLGVISADGKKLLHKVDIKLKAGTLMHDIGVSENYNIILDYPLRFGTDRLLSGKPFIGFEKGEQSRIGVMPRYGNADSVMWFNVKSNCSFHIINTFEDGDEVVVQCCRASDSVIQGVDRGVDWYRRAYARANENSKSFDPEVDGILFTVPYQWRLSMKTGMVKEGNLTRKEMSMDFPIVNSNFVGVRNKYAYMQLVDPAASGITGLPMFNGFAKLHLDVQDKDGVIRVEHLLLEENHYCSGVAFVEKRGGIDEDDGWLVSYVHDEAENKSKVYIIDAKNLKEGPVARIILPRRVPYGFHSTYLAR